MEVRIVISTTGDIQVYNLPEDLREMVQFVWEAGAAGADIYVEQGEDEE